ncbi:MAG: CvpA family protein [Dehalococcoidia bacterium]|nr:CvpA family protein [Dehalococcoidia bacterium]
MNWLDILITISLVASLIGGLAMGFIRGFIALIGLVAGIIVAGKFYDGLAAHLGFIHHENTAGIIAFAIIFIATMFLAAIIAQILHKVITRIMLGWLDHLLGGLTGLLAGALSWGLLLALWAKFFGGATLESSLFAPFMAAKFPLVLTLLPPEFDSVREFFR